MITQLPATLGRLLDVPTGDVAVHDVHGVGADAVLVALGRPFFVQVIPTGSAGPIAARIARIEASDAPRSEAAIPLIATPFMGASGKEVCARAGVSWLDFSGNARISAPGIRVLVDGQPNQFRGRGRPASAFAPKSARVVRWLLTHPDRAFSQRDIARAVGISEGLVSRVVSRLVTERYLTRAADGGVLVERPRLLLEAWREEYRFDKHEIIKGHLAARSGDALTRVVADALTRAGIEHAATGLSAAWQLTRFVGFRIASFYAGAGAAEALAAFGFREQERGANLWLVRQNDDGVLQGASERDGVHCVHPVQVLLDLDGHPERAAEAAERVRTEILNV